MISPWNSRRSNGAIHCRTALAPIPPVHPPGTTPGDCGVTPTFAAKARCTTELEAPLSSSASASLPFTLMPITTLLSSSMGTLGAALSQ